MKSTYRSIFLTSVLTLLAFGGVLYTSCKQDKCKAIVCAYGGTCIDGACKCLPGYEGTSCETVARDKFIGFYNVIEQGTITPLRQYPLAITADPSDVRFVLINNAYNYFSGAITRAQVKGDTLIIPNQQLLGKVIVGWGTMGHTPSYQTGPANFVTMNYEVVDSASGNRIVDDIGLYHDVDNSEPSKWIKY